MIALSLVGLLCIAALVVWRRMTAVAENRVVRALETKKRELVSQRTALERDLVDATSRARIVPAAEKRLGMHVATELEVRNLTAPNLRDSIVRDTVTSDTLSRVNSTSTGALASNAAAKRAGVRGTP